MPSNHGDLTGIYVENRFVYGLRSGTIPAGMKIAGPVPDDDNFQATYRAEDMENPKNAAGIVEVDAPRRKNVRVSATLTSKATTWIEQLPKATPFFLYFTPVAVHNPITPDKDLAGKSAAGLYGDWIHELDRSVGGILDALDKKGVAKDTLVIFTSDNGGVKVPSRVDTPQTKALNAGLAVNGLLRGGKHSVWEGGFKVPFIARWPAKVAAGSVCKELVSLADILATTAEIVGESLPAMDKAAEDSRSFLPALLGDAKGRDDVIVHSSDGVFAIRKGPWKWIEGVPVDGLKTGAKKAHAAEFRQQLYNTTTDPAETQDVSAAHPEVVKELAALLNRYRDGGYSRELPPIGTRSKTAAVELPLLNGTVLLSEPLSLMPGKPWIASRGAWSAKDGGVWGSQANEKEQPATLRVPLSVTDGAIEYEIQFDGANRHSLRVECAGKKHSFRIEVSRPRLGITKNPSQGESKEAVEPLASKPMQLEARQWYPVRVTFKGNEVTAQVNNVVVKGSHAVLAEPKTGANFLVFGEAAGFRNVKVIQ